MSWRVPYLHCHGRLQLLLRHLQPLARLVDGQITMWRVGMGWELKCVRGVGAAKVGCAHASCMHQLGSRRHSKALGLTSECVASSAKCGALTNAMRQNGHSNAAAAHVVGTCVCAFVRSRAGFD